MFSFLIARGNKGGSNGIEFNLHLKRESFHTNEIEQVTVKKE